MMRIVRARGPLLALLVVISAVAVVRIESLGVDLGGVNVTLQSQRYYATWNLTRLVYRVKGLWWPMGQSLVLAVDECVTDDVIDMWASTSYDWVTEPFRGLRYAYTGANQKIYLWLIGRWDVAETNIAWLPGGWMSEPIVGQIEGPYCEGATLSLSVVGDASIVFPDIAGTGTFPVPDGTTLRVTSSSADWSISHRLDLDVPESASESVVARIFGVEYGSYQPRAGTSDIAVSYALVVGEEDLAGLPEGDYVVQITFTVAEN